MKFTNFSKIKIHICNTISASLSKKLFTNFHKEQTPEQLDLEYRKIENDTQILSTSLKNLTELEEKYITDINTVISENNEFTDLSHMISVIYNAILDGIIRKIDEYIKDVKGSKNNDEVLSITEKIQQADDDITLAEKTIEALINLEKRYAIVK